MTTPRTYNADGSLRVTHVDGYDDTHARMAGERRRYEAATELTPWLVDELDAFLGDAASRSIRVVALLPPYTPTIYDELRARGRWPYLWRTYADLAPVFARTGMELYDYTDPRALGLTDSDFYDGHHGTERAYAKILLDAAKKSPTLAAVVDAPRTVRMLEDTNDRLSIAGDFPAGE